jgi:hypothetical protein
LFEKVYVIKPNTSNITTFDKYIICKNFIFNESKINQYKVNYLNLLIFLKKLEDKYIISIFDFDLPYYFTTKLTDMNVTIGQQQLEALDQIISILKNKNKDDKIETIKKSNIQKSVSWCEKYKIPCNKFTEKTNIFLPIVKDDGELNEEKDSFEPKFYLEDVVEIEIEQECVNCCEDKNKFNILMCCSKELCVDCVDKWFGISVYCPYCKKDLRELT